MELWDIYDHCFNKTNRFHKRGDALAPGDYHLVVSIYPINKRKEILIQKRSDTVAWVPGIWAATGGSALAGESIYEAAKRELEEELGLTADDSNMELIAVFKRETSFNGVWIVFCDVKLEELTLQKEEVSAVKWVTMEEIKEMIARGEFHAYSYIDWLSDYIKNI